MLKRAAVRGGAPDPINGGGNNKFPHEQLIRQLSTEDRAALEELARDPPRRSVPSHEAFRLLELGLAELICGRLVLTRAGISARAVLRDL